jgi:hypothetical protein
MYFVTHLCIFYFKFVSLFHNRSSNFSSSVFCFAFFPFAISCLSVFHFFSPSPLLIVIVFFSGYFLCYSTFHIFSFCPIKFYSFIASTFTFSFDIFCSHISFFLLCHLLKFSSLFSSILHLLFLLFPRPQ